MPQRHGGEVSAGNVDGKEAPAPRLVRRRPVVEARRRPRARRRACGTGADSASPVALLIASLHVHSRRSARRRASSSSACQRGLLAGRHELARHAVDVDRRARRARCRRRCARSTRHAEERDAARVRHVEVDVVAPATSGRPRRPRPMTTSCGGDAELAPEQAAQRRASHDVAIAKVRPAEAPCACVLRVGQQRGERGDVRRACAQARTSIRPRLARARRAPTAGEDGDAAGHRGQR